ncbi:hypothetical protein LGQ02_01500 [Bacillus shivajii]|uniref:hypothetical protein n=1 Tax=Bacillus shivajii TaxID=1983719 RepID=UPI001CF9D215|nr:hypothetical protein [Bacillus shivajii]UCZ53505.1 hypothetical protein LGQ02_01500 [Bacillus shivajii]
MNRKSESPCYFDGRGIENFRLQARNKKNEVIIKPKNVGKLVKFPHYPYLVQS